MAAEAKAKLTTELGLAGADKFAKGLQLSVGAVDRLKAAFKTVNEGMFFGRSNLGAIFGALKGVGDQILGPSIQLDALREKIQFVGLNSEEARKKIEEMLEWSGKLDQPHSGMVGAWIQLRKYGLADTYDQMQLISDAAKYADSDVASMAATFGVLKQKIAAGRDFDAAARSLLNMGLISGETMQRIQALNDAMSGKTHEDAIDAIEKEMDLLKERLQLLGESPERASLAGRYNELQRERLRMKTEPPPPAPDVSNLWAELMKEIGGKTVSVGAADKTLGDAMQRKKDVQAFVQDQAFGALIGNSVARMSAEQDRMMQLAMSKMAQGFGDFVAPLLDKLVQGSEFAQNPVFGAVQGGLKAFDLAEAIKASMLGIFQTQSVTASNFPVGMPAVGAYSPEIVSNVNRNMEDTVRITGELNTRLNTLIKTVDEGVGRLR